jgi:RNA polymerase sigma factor (sigma-70 family)
MTSNPRDDGERFLALAPRLRLALAHLSSPSIRARVELDDLVQEVFLRAWSARRELPPHEPGDACLYRLLVRIARNTVIDVARALRAHKRNARTVPLSRSDWSHAGVRESQVVHDAPGVSTQVAASEDWERLLNAFRALSPEHRRVIGLRQFESLSAAETAQRMKRSEAAVHSLYRRALDAWNARMR